MDKPTVVMMGLGYIGLPTAALMASKKIEVKGVDVNTHVVNTINKGEIHIIEPDLGGLVKEVVQKGFLKAYANPTKADIFLIAVPTPFKGNYEPDISYVESATGMIIPYLKSGDLVIIESTSPIGTTEKMADLIYSKKPELIGKIYIAYCPERVLPGQVIYELQNNDRVIGGIDEISAEKACEFYSLFVKGNLHKTNARTAEMCKLVENSYRDVNIAFANELSIISEKAGVNVWELINLASKHPRVNILQPGPGVGGHCIAIDPWFLVSDFKQDAKLIRAAREVNISKTEWVLEKIHEKMSKFNKDKAIIACMGLSYKPDIDDLRESPSLEITKHLLANGYKVLPVEPNLEEHKDITLVDYREAVNMADIIVFLVPHRQFKNLKISSDKVILDYCGVIK
jgi:UDP-N-acetyl-D-mannosaminuronic acid dehydrogenase